jgi:hypothetical protein
MGYDRYVPEIGTTQRHGQAPKHTRDGTNYLNHAFYARGGDITREDFPTHRRNFPSHVHMYPETDDMTIQTKRDRKTEVLADPNILQDPNGDGSRGYTRVTPELEARVLATQHHLGATTSHAEIADKSGVPLRTVKYILTDLPRLRRSKGGDEVARSLKERVYGVIEEWNGSRVPDVAELRTILGFADTEHDIVHVLHSLHTQGRIDFDERGSEQGRTTYVNIRLAKKGGAKTVAPTSGPSFTGAQVKAGASRVSGQVGVDYTSPYNQPSTTSGGPVEVVRPEATEEQAQQLQSAPEPEVEGYPLLDALLEREGKRLAQDAAMMAYVNAAEAILDIDRDMFDTLMAKASALDVVYPSPIESEFLRYVAAHPKGDSK